VSWLHALFGVVVLTSEVERELWAGGVLERAIERALDEGWLRRFDGFSEVTGGRSDADLPVRPPHLGDGEWSTIVAGLYHKGPTLLVLDDRLARREARAHGLEMAGTAAVIVAAARRNLVDSPQLVFDRLLQSGFRLSPRVIREALDSFQRPTESRP
jgi:predicted nucleic acid-binding protein